MITLEDPRFLGSEVGGARVEDSIGPSNKAVLLNKFRRLRLGRLGWMFLSEDDDGVDGDGRVSGVATTA